MAYLIGVAPQRGRQASAIAIVEAESISSATREKDCAVRHLEIGALGGTHKQLIDRVGELYKGLRSQNGVPFLVRVVLDGTTLEEASLRLWRGQVYRPRSYAVGTTARPAAKPGYVPVTRKELFDLLNVALQPPQRVRVASQLALTPELYRQLGEPRLARPPAPAAPGDFDADEVADNLALAVALAVWEADHSRLEASPPGPIVATTSFNVFGG